MLKIIYKIIIFSLFLNFSFNLPAGDQKQIDVVRIDSSPKMDGILDDKVWENVPVSSDFRMIIPETGKDPSERTELKIAYNDKCLYISIKCYSSDPKKISVNTLKYDQHGRWSNGDDIVRILIDPFLDMRNAYVFIVNPKARVKY